jgi:hypothetical protein
MPIVSSLYHDRKTMIAVASGPVSWEEVKLHLFEERFEDGLSYSELIDARTATPTWSSAQSREFVDLLTAFGAKTTLGPTAVVVSDDFSFGMLRMLEILLEHICIVKPFHDYGEAEQWLHDLKIGRKLTTPKNTEMTNTIKEML